MIHELSLYINFDIKRLGNVIKQTFGKP